MMFTVLQTVVLWGLNPQHWLCAFLQACAENARATPSDLSSFLPWDMSQERKKQLARPLPVAWPSTRESPAEPEILDTS